MILNKNIFREYDIRGVVNKDIDENVAYLIGRAFGTNLVNLGKTKTIVGYDNRLSSEKLEEAFVKGVTECGVDVVRLGLVTTPMYYYAWDLLNIKCGCMITASHNPKEDNGFKFSYNGIHNAFGKASLELYERIMKNDFITSLEIGKIENVNIYEEYAKMITSDLNFPNKIKVVYDCGNGTTAIIADKIFNCFSDKLELIPLFNESDGTFPNHHPDPAVEENLTLLKQKVLETKADIGVAFDGDGDRIGVIDNLGNFISADKLMILIWKDLATTNVEKKTFYDVKCSKALKEELDKLGIVNDYYKTGNAYGKAKSYTENYPFAGELSGHVYFKDRFIGSDDGIYAGLRIIEILSKYNTHIPDMLNGISHYETSPEIKVSVTDDNKFKIVDMIKDYAISKNYDVNLIDGVLVSFKDGGALVRASNTGPNLTCRFEAKTIARLIEIKSEFLLLIEEIKKGSL